MKAVAGALVMAASVARAATTCSSGWAPAPVWAATTWSDRCYRVEQGRTSLLQCIEACETHDAVPVCVSSGRFDVVHTRP